MPLPFGLMPFFLWRAREVAGSEVVIKRVAELVQALR